jgi:hypothetical protein
VSVPAGNVYGMVMQARSRARKAQGKQCRHRNQKEEAASRHGVLPAAIDDATALWSRAIQPNFQSHSAQ